MSMRGEVCPATSLGTSSPSMRGGECPSLAGDGFPSGTTSHCLDPLSIPQATRDLHLHDEGQQEGARAREGKQAELESVARQIAVRVNEKVLQPEGLAGVAAVFTALS